MNTTQLAGLAREYAASLDAKGRAELLEYLARAVYESVKFDHPEGGGFDGRDGQERTSLARILDEAIEHHGKQSARMVGQMRSNDG